MKNKNFKAFTLAEVLITLAIIGVVAALTIPTLVTSYQKKMYVTQLKKSYNNLTNGFKTAMAQDGVTKLSDTTLWSKMSEGFVSYNIIQNEDDQFLDEFKKMFKISAIYNGGELPERYNVEYKLLNGESSLEQADFGIYLADGAWLQLFLIKKPSANRCNGSSDCTSLSEFQTTYNTKTKLWQNVGDIVIDINGPKGPNAWGRDVFVFILGNDGILYPDGGADVAIFNDGSCKYDDLKSCDYYWKNESGLRDCNLNLMGIGCAGRIMEENWTMNY